MTVIFLQVSKIFFHYQKEVGVWQKVPSLCSEYFHVFCAYVVTPRLSVNVNPKVPITNIIFALRNQLNMT